tara:strand:+ start:1818 stop:2027 length:210 start_codon:yes stop_codon:yes gene_type:complete
MSLRYYIGTATLILILTLAISFWTKKQAGKEIFEIFIKVATVFVAIIGGVLALGWFLAFLGIAQSGFIL